MLHELKTYGEKLGGEPGFKVREVKWCIALSKDGQLLNILPLGDGKKGASLERCPDMHSMNAGGKSHFLVETAQFIALLFKEGEDEKRIQSSQQRHDFYRHLMVDASKKIERLSPISTLLQDDKQLEALLAALAGKGVKPTDWVSWRIGEEYDPRIDPEVQAWWRTWREFDLQPATFSSNKNNEQSASQHMVCILTGEPIPPLATHSKITGLAGVGGIAMGDVLVGFDKPAFTSFGLDQAQNAAMSAEAAQQYIDGLNDLIKNHSRKLANALTVHWFKKHIPKEDDPFALLYGLESEDQTKISAQAEARRLLDAIRTGKQADLSDNHFYAITLSGASGRVMIRDWMEGQFESLVKNIDVWFNDLSIIARDGKNLAPSPKFLAVCGALVNELKDLPATTTAVLWRSATLQQPIPNIFLAQSLARFRTTLIKDEPFNHARMGLIKAYFIRKLTEGDSNMKPYLNPEHPKTAYHCGRLLAVLANLQRAALRDVGAGVVQRYYSAASQTPGLTLGRLISNARNHLGKLEGGLSWWYEEQIAEIMGHMKDNIPRTLDLEGQGLFALGYYQQLATLRAGNKSNDTQTSKD